jgi:hypothetical protein
MSRTRFARRSRTTAALIAALGIVVGSIAFASPAAADGSLHLTVQDSNSDPIPFLHVEFDDGAGTVYSDTTDASGILDASGIAPGTYQVYVLDTFEYVDDQTPLVVIDDPSPTTATLTLLDTGRVQGSIPADAGGAASEVTFYYYDSVSDDFSPGPVQSVEADGSFELPIPYASGLSTYAVHVDVPDDVPYLDTFYNLVDDVLLADTIDAGIPGTIYGLGPVDLIPSGLISGVVEDTFGNSISGATVTAQDTTTFATYTVGTDLSGEYSLQVPSADASYEVWSSATGYDPEWYPNTDFSSFVEVEVTTSDRWVEDVDFSLESMAQSVLGNTIYRDASNLIHPFDVEVDLFEADGLGTFSPDPIDYSGFFDEFTFIDLPDGTYRLGFLDENGYYTSWSNYFDGPTTVTPTGPNGACYIEFTTTAGLPDLVFGDILLEDEATPDTCDGSPWATPSDGVFTGSVLNIADFDSPVRAFLGSATDGALLDSSPVDPTTGGYSLWGIHDSTGYFVEFETSGTDPFLDTLLGEDTGLPLLLWAGPDENWEDVADTYYIPIVPFSDSYGHDVTLPDATVYTGTVTSSGLPVEDACMYIESYGDPNLYACDRSDADGRYIHKVPVGETWNLMAGAFGFDIEYWDDAADLVDATPLVFPTAGVDPAHYDFDLAGQNTGIFGFVEDYVGPVSGIKVHVYKPVAGGWTELTTITTDPISAQFALGQADMGTLPSTFRLRFESATGQWLQLDRRLATFVTSVSDFVDEQTCFIDVPTMRPGPVYIFSVRYDPAQAPGACGAEPVPGSGGGSSTGGATKHHGTKKFIGVTETPTPTATPTPSPTPTETAEPEATPSPTATPIPDVPAVSGGLPAWVWIIIAILILVVCGGGFVILRRR